MARLRFETTPEITVNDESTVFKAAAGATAPLVEFKNSSGTVVATIAANGNLTAADLNLSGNLVVTGATTSPSTAAAIDLKANIASPTFTGTVTIPAGASITAPNGLVKGDVGLANVDNTSDVNKPVSTAQQTALDLKANLASPALTGTPTAPTAAAATNTTQIATTEFVRAEVAALVNGATATLDTLGEIATALGNDANLSTTLTNSIALKAPINSPTFTGTPTLPTGTIAVTQTAADSTTAVATTAFVTTADNLKANLASPALTGTPTAPTADAGTSTTQIATTAFVFSSVDNDQFVLAGQVF